MPIKMADVAQMAGVSIATVSRVLNEPEKVKPETRDRVQQVLDRTGFVANGLARGLVTSSMQAIGVLTVDVRDLYFASVTYSIEQYFSRLGYNVILANTGGELGGKKKYLQVMLEKQVDGLILVGSVFKEQSGNKHILEAAQKVPVVMINSQLEGENLYSVICDDAQGVYAAVKMLIGKGRSHLWYFEDVKSFSGFAKVEGFKRGMVEGGFNPETILEVSRDLAGGRDGIRRILEAGKKCDGIITGEDIVAVGAVKELTTAGIPIPEQVAVSGYNNSILAETATPALSSVDNLQEEMAREAVQLLYDRLHGKSVPVKTILTPSLVLRASTPR